MDISKVATLLHIADQASKHSTTLSGIYGEAMIELTEINAEAIKSQQTKAAQVAKEVALAEQAARAKVESEAKALEPKMPVPQRTDPTPTQERARTFAASADHTVNDRRA